MKHRVRQEFVLAAALTAVAATGVMVRGQGSPDVVWETRGHSRTVEAVAFSPDGAVLASGADYDDSTVKLWNVSDGSPLGTFADHGGSVLSVEFSATGGLLAVGHIVNGYPPGGRVTVWDVNQQTVRQTFGGCFVAFSPDGEYLASGGGGANRYVQIHRIADGQNIATIYTGAYILDVAYSPHGQLVASSGTDNAVRLWDAATGVAVRTLSGHTDDVSAIAFSPDGELLASGAGGWDEPGESTVKIWRVSDGALLDTLPGHGTWVYDVAFSPDGRHLITSGRTGSAASIRIWRVADGELVQHYDQGVSYGVPTVRFSPAGGVFAYGRGGGYVAVANSPLALLGDLNGDGRVDLADLGILLADFGCTAGPGNCPGDIDGDGDTDLGDLGILLSNFGR